MEYRKLISFGKSSYVISLPKAWVVQNKLKKGDLIYVDEKESSLILSPNDSHENGDELETLISVDGKEIKQIKREIIGAYIRNSKTIILSGNEIKDKAKVLQQIIQSLVAMEVMEQTSKKIVAKDFLNMNDVSTGTIIRKIDIIIRSMFDDCVNVFEDDTSDNIEHRDEDINKLTFLIFRIVKFGMESSSYMIKKFNLRSRDLLDLWLLSSDLESIADEVKRISRYMVRIKLTKKEKEKFKDILKEIKTSYLIIMKAYYDKSIEPVHKTINQREGIIARCEQFYKDNKPVEEIGFLVDRTKACIVHIHHIGRTLYQ
jgi:phosphate uptake regulator